MGNPEGGQRGNATSSRPVRPSRAVAWLAAAIAALLIVAAGVGLFWSAGAGPSSFTTHRGQVADLYGRGVYRYDTRFVGAGNRGTDFVTLTLGVPALVAATILYRRGSLRGALLLTGVLTYILYVYGSLALGAAAYNALFLVYVALFSASLYALALACRSIDLRAMPPHLMARLPRRGPAVFMFASGLVTAVIWLSTPLEAMIRGVPPARLDTYTTLFTHALDLAVIVPATFLAGALILRRAVLGYLIACPLLGLIALLGPAITAQTTSQLAAGVAFAPAEVIGPIGGFGVVALAGIGVMIAILRRMPDTVVARPAAGGAAMSAAKPAGA
jgi:hypothetical protein